MRFADPRITFRHHRAAASREAKREWSTLRVSVIHAFLRLKTWMAGTRRGIRSRSLAGRAGPAMTTIILKIGVAAQRTFTSIEPMPSMVARKVAPLCSGPTPSGVPVRITSPG